MLNMFTSIFRVFEAIPGADIISSFFEALGEILLGLLAALTSVLDGIIPIFWTAAGPTLYGIFLIFGVGFFFVMFAWRVIQGFIRK